MGYGAYSLDAHQALIAGRAGLDRSEVFTQRGCHPLMNPRGLKVRESRDSPDHPASLGIVFALDVTGSMGQIPGDLARKELPGFMKLLDACGVPDPQILFMAIGDATTDGAPLQVGQFESTAELMDQWLTWSFLEGGGGGQNHESYELAFYVAAQHMDMDCMARRRRRGYLFMTGDELPYPAVSRHQVDTLLGERLDEDIPVEEVIAAAAESFHLFFLVPDPRRRENCETRWRELLGDHVICLEDSADTCAVAASIVGLTEGRLAGLDQVAASLSAQGWEKARIAAVVRALRPYAALLDPHGVLPEPTPDAPAPGWWKKLFG